MEQRILEIIAKICGVDSGDITPELDLFEAGLLDSFGTLEMLVALSEEFSVDIDVSDVTREQMASVEMIVGTISEMKGAV